MTTYLIKINPAFAFHAALTSLLLLFSISTVAIEKDASHSYQSCSMITAELLTTTQLYGRGIPLDLLIKSLPDLSKQGENRVRNVYQSLTTSDLLSSYSAINSDYAKCAKKVHSQRGKPKPTAIEYGYYFCAGENKLRYEIALAIYLKASKEEVIPQLPRSRQDIGSHYFDLAEQSGLEAVFDLMANNLKQCLNQIPAKNK